MLLTTYTNLKSSQRLQNLATLKLKRTNKKIQIFFLIYLFQGNDLLLEN